jgi:hypothetical protein
MVCLATIQNAPEAVHIREHSRVLPDTSLANRDARRPDGLDFLVPGWTSQHFCRKVKQTEACTQLIQAARS